MKKLRKKTEKYLVILAACVLGTCIVSVLVMAFKYDMAVDIRISPAFELGVDLIRNIP